MKSDHSPEKSADKIRTAAEHERKFPDSEKNGARDETDSVEAYHDLSGPEMSKGRPQKRPSNAGNDGT